jgi:putative ABC transport system permease protein
MGRSEYGPELWRDAGYAVRMLRRTPGFTLLAVATLALGIGASTAIFTVVDAVLLRPLRFMESQRLAMVWTSAGSRVSEAYLHDWRLESQTFADLAGWYDVPVNLTSDGEPLEVQADRVTSNFFAVLGTPALLGRTLTIAADLREVEAEVVLSHGLWQRRYGGDPAVVGRLIAMDGEHLTIVGVMPEGFTLRTLELAASRAELWTPFALAPGDRAGMGGFLNVVGRLAPGVTVAQAGRELSLISQRIEEAHPSFTRRWSVVVLPLHEATVKDVRLTLLILFGAVGILLLIACTNVAHLMLSRSASRQTELAIRLSLGATSRRLVRQMLTESIVLALAGGAIGVLLAVWGTRLLVSALPSGLDLPRVAEIGVDVRILGFALLVTILTALLFGLVPALRATRWAAQSALRQVSRGSSPAGTRTRLGGTFVVSQVALAVVLLAGAALLGRSFNELTRVDPGFEPEQVLTFRVRLPAGKYDSDDRVRAFSRELLQRIERLPGVEAVGSAGYLPMSRTGIGGAFEIESRPQGRPDERPGAWITTVGGRYFDAMGIPLLRGRLFSEAESDKTQPVFVIDEALARRHWPGDDPIGSRIRWPGALGERDVGAEDAAADPSGGDAMLSGEIIGVVGSVRWVGMAAEPQATVYSWFPQAPGRQITIVARTAGDPGAMAHLVATQVREIDPNQPIGEVRPMRDFVSADLARPRLTMGLLGGFAAAALLLAAIGLYGVMAFNVAQRTQEIGVRVALGARPVDVLRLVMQRGVLLTGIGLAIGLAAALALGPVVATLLYGITPADPATLLAAGVLLAGVAVLATYLPARRAARLSPMVALKE